MERIVTLADVPSGFRCRVVSIEAGLGLKTRLLQMGLTPGSEVMVIENYWNRIVIEVRGSTIALSRGMARKIMVSIIT